MIIVRRTSYTAGAEFPFTTHIACLFPVRHSGRPPPRRLHGRIWSAQQSLVWRLEHYVTSYGNWETVGAEKMPSFPTSDYVSPLCNIRYRPVNFTPLGTVQVIRGSVSLRKRRHWEKAAELTPIASGRANAARPLPREPSSRPGVVAGEAVWKQPHQDRPGCCRKHW